MADITVTQLTSGDLIGSGVFDKLMQAVDVRLDAQYKLGRINGTDYASVYLGSLESAMAQAVAFILGEQQASAQAELLIKQAAAVDQEILKAAEEVELTIEQKLKIIQETKNLVSTDLGIDAGTAQTIATTDKLEGVDTQLVTANIAKMVVEETLLIKQVDKLTSDISTAVVERANLGKQGNLIDAQAEKTEDEGNLLTANLGKVPKEILVLDGQVAKLNSDVSTGAAARQKMTKEGHLVDIQADKANAEKLYIMEKDLTEAVVRQVKAAEVIKMGAEGDKMVAEVAVMQQEVVNVGKKGTVLDRQASKLAAEKLLLDKKIVTEDKQGNSAPHVNSIMGKQAALYTKQAAGFDRDAEAKLAKIMGDAYSVGLSADANGVYGAFSETACNSVIARARAGISS